MRRLVLLSATLLAITLASACIDPCDSLADRICKCEETDLEQTTCTQRVAIEKDKRDSTEADRAACEAALKTCTCEALTQGELSKCGYSR